MVLGRVGLAYELHGDLDVPPLVLLHALGEGRSDWAPVVNRFAEHVRVVTVDLRGHGDSDWPGTYSFRFMADDVLRLLDHLGLAHVRLLGHSMGGCVAYLIAEQSPGRVELLIVEDAPPPFVRERPVPERPKGELRFDRAMVTAIIGEVSSGNQTMWDRLSSITAPTLLVGAGPESHIPQEKQQEVAERIPECSRVTIPAGHLVHATRATDFIDAVLGWFARTQLS